MNIPQLTRYLLPSLLLSLLGGNAAAQELGERQTPMRLPRVFTPAPAASTLTPAVASSSGMMNDELLAPTDVLHDRHHQVKLDAAGAFNGRLWLPAQQGVTQPAGNVQVRIIQRGEVLQTGSTNSDGVFSFTGLPEGVVGLVGTSPDAIVLFSLRLVREESAGAEPSAFEIDFESSVISQANVSVANKLIAARLPSRDKRFGEAISQTEQSYEFGTGRSSTSVHSHQVQLQPDGSLIGQVNILDSRTGMHREIVDLTLHFLQDGASVVQTEIDATGRFSISGLTPGVYGVVTTGDDGVLALGLEVIAALSPAAKRSNEHTLTSNQECLELVVAPVNAENFNCGNASHICEGEIVTLCDEVDPGFGEVVEGPFGGPMGQGMGGYAGGGGGSFGGGGGGGGVGGGGGLGALLGVAAAGAIGYVVSQDDDNTASPSR